MSWLFDKFDRLMTRLGRKHVFVGYIGDIALVRYCLLRKESLHAYRKPGTPANLYLHIFYREEETDGNTVHTHSATTVSLILKGEYWEQLSTGIKHRKAGTVQVVKFGETHGIRRCRAGTMTLFWRFKAVADFKISMAPCEDVCQHCIDTNNGVCYSTDKAYELEDFDKQLSTKEGDWSFMKWFVWGDAAEKKIRYRRKALQKLGVSLPQTGKEARYLVRDRSNLPFIKAKS